MERAVAKGTVQSNSTDCTVYEQRRDVRCQSSEAVARVKRYNELVGTGVCTPRGVTDGAAIRMRG